VAVIPGTVCTSDDSIAVKKFGLKIPRGYRNNDEILLGVTFYLDTLSEWQLYIRTSVF